MGSEDGNWNVRSFSQSVESNFQTFSRTLIDLVSWRSTMWRIAELFCVLGHGCSNR